MAEIHPAVELLIKRMKSNPEEFINYSGNHHAWAWIAQYEEHFTEEERELINAEYRNIYMENFHARAMKQILDPEPQQQGLYSSLQQTKEQIRLQGLRNIKQQLLPGLTNIWKPL